MLCELFDSFSAREVQATLDRFRGRTKDERIGIKKEKRGSHGGGGENNKGKLRAELVYEVVLRALLPPRRKFEREVDQFYIVLIEEVNWLRTKV